MLFHKNHPYCDMDSYVLDLGSGTYFSASRAVIIELEKLSDEEIRIFEGGSDSDRVVLGETYGTYVE